jgi:hypothetical protein
VSAIVQAARTAREKLAAALALLQSPEAGDLIDSVAPPVAAAMGSLHSVERSQGTSAKDAVPQALTHVQEALAALQLAPSSSKIVDEATAFVATSLGLVHGLSRDLKSSEAAKPPVTSPEVPRAAAAEPEGETHKTQVGGRAGPGPSPAEPTRPAPVVTAQMQAPDHVSRGVPAPAPTPAAPEEVPNAPAAVRPTTGLDRTALSRDVPDFSESDKEAERQRTKAALAATAQVPSTPLETTRGTAPVNAAAKTPSGAGPGTTADFQDSRHAAPPPEGRPPGSVLVEANLGAHSPTNFFKGLSGNDVVDDGGIFIATYDIPKPGTPLWIHVTLPGGYEFEAAGAVRWTREAGAGDAPPGFGAIFIRLSPEARQLVYRYVRNREPIFYDDI